MSANRLIWFKGALIPADQALVPVLSPTAQFGLNVFEGIRGYWNPQTRDINLFRLPEHLDRLDESCRLIGITSPYDSAQITGFIRDVLRANDYRCDVAVRATLFVDEEGSWSSSTPVDMFVAPIDRPRRDINQTSGARACISTWERISDRAFPPRIKAGANYINGRYAHLEAQRNGYDLPVLLGRDGTVSEGAGSCLFMVRRGRLVTPTATNSILESITRDTLIQIATAENLPVDIRPIDRTELYMADELFLCGSAAELTPLTSIDGHQMGAGTIGPITRHLLTRYLNVASGLDPEFTGWQTPVYTTKDQVS